MTSCSPSIASRTPVPIAGKPSPGVPEKSTPPTRSAEATVRTVLPTTHGFSRERSRRAPS